MKRLLIFIMIILLISGSALQAQRPASSVGGRLMFIQKSAAEIATIGNPPAGTVYVYAKDDGLLYYKLPDGTEYCTGGGAAEFTSLSLSDNTSGKILIGDGSSYVPIAMSGDATIDANGIVTISAATDSSASTKKVFVNIPTAPASVGTDSSAMFMLDDGYNIWLQWLTDDNGTEKLNTAATKQDVLNGDVSQSLWFDGDDDYVNINSLPAISDGNEWSFVIQAFFDSNANTRLIDIVGGYFSFAEAPGDLQLYDGSAYMSLFSNIEENKYYNLAVVSDGSNWLSYENGIYLQQQTPSNTGIAFDYLGATSLSHSGLIYSFKFFNLALDPTDPEDLAIIEGGAVPEEFQRASNTIISTYDTTKTSDSATVEIDLHYTFTKGNTDSCLINGTVYTVSGGDTDFVATTTLFAAYGDLTNSNLRHTGCVADYPPSGIGHNQWTEVSGNKLHGTINGAKPVNLPANHSEIYNLTVTGETTFSLPSGYMIDYIIAKETTGNTITALDFGFTDGGGEIVAAADFTGSDEASLTVVQRIDDFDAEDTVYISATAWNSASLDVVVRMKRMIMN